MHPTLFETLGCFANFGESVLLLQTFSCRVEIRSTISNEIRSELAVGRTNVYPLGIQTWNCLAHPRVSSVL